MDTNKEHFDSEEIFHVYNRGTDKRAIFIDDMDHRRFLESLREFNTPNNIALRDSGSPTFSRIYSISAVSAVLIFWEICGCKLLFY